MFGRTNPTGSWSWKQTWVSFGSSSLEGGAALRRSAPSDSVDSRTPTWPASPDRRLLTLLAYRHRLLMNPQTPPQDATTVPESAKSRVVRIDTALGVLAVGLLLIASVVPIWFVRYQPLPDHAEHLAAAAILHHYRDTGFEFSRYYAPSLGLVPLLGILFFRLVICLSGGRRYCQQDCLSMYVTGLPIGFALLAKQFGRESAPRTVFVPAGLEF